MLDNMSYDELMDMSSLFQNLGTICFIIAAIGILFLIFVIMRKRHQIKTRKRITMSRIAFAGDIFGAIYEPTEEYPSRYATIQNTQGEEICRIVQDEAQYLKGFHTENNTIYLYITEYTTGAPVDIKWRYDAETQDFIECDNS